MTSDAVAVDTPVDQELSGMAEGIGEKTRMTGRFQQTKMHVFEALEAENYSSRGEQRAAYGLDKN